MRGQSLIEHVVIWAAVLLLALSVSNPIVYHVSRHMRQAAERIRK